MGVDPADDAAQVHINKRLVTVHALLINYLYNSSIGRARSTVEAAQVYPDVHYSQTVYIQRAHEHYLQTSSN